MNHSQHILLVDDEIRFGETLKQILAFYGYQVTIATCGREAVDLLNNHVFDVALLDLELPDMYGYNIIDSVQENNRFLVTIMLTGNGSMETAIQAMRKGVYDYLKKPIDSDLLLKTIEKATEHQQLEKSLRASEERFKILADASWEGIVIHDQGILLESNQQFLNIFGYKSEELLGVNILEKIFIPQAVTAINTRIKNGEVGFHESVGLKKNGTIFPIETNSRYMEYHDRTVRVCAIRDISTRVAAEQEKIKLLEKLAITNKMETLGLMAGSIAHDLNNILSGIVTFPEIILMQMDKTEKHREAIEFIRDTGKRAAAVVSDLLLVARGASAPTKTCCLNRLIQNHLASIEHQAITSLYKEVIIKTKLADDLFNIKCSEIHISKVLMNLINNALEAIKKNGTIVLSTCNRHIETPVQEYERINAGDYAVLSIFDNGPGIPEQSLNKIFEPFYSKKVMGRSGTGLGLTIVWNTIHDHNGYVNVQSNENGTLFELFFPATRQEIEGDSAGISINAFRGNGETILIVDDQQDQRTIACNLLSNLNYTTYAVASGEEAVAYLQQNKADLVILDMIMEPGINGRQTYEQILTINPSQKAIIASGFSEDNEVKKIHDLGIIQFIKKPYTMEQIGIAIKQALHYS
ncbi:MAG: response regulator [Proteobacteria bacterium]|nr:response regulator [Pseudomonadota bacterium]MBU1650012.1 response regulator [Pseudomonadota bacterium]